MFAFLGKMFGTQKAGEAIIEGTTSAIDKMFYTSEEKAEDTAKARTEGLQVYMEWLKSTSGSRLARRSLALMTSGVWVIEHLSSVVLGVAGVFVDNPDKFIEASKMLAEHANNNNALVGVVLLFYFGGPAATDGVKGLVEKWANKEKPASG